MLLLLKDKKILITGGTGTLGRALTKKLLTENVSSIRVLSRDEGKQLDMASTISDSRVRYIVGDVRDRDRVIYAFEDIDIVFHVAALKQVPVAEYNPFEAVKTNVLGSQNVIDACLANKVKIAMAVSSDKAVSPLNTYGATKLLMERIFVAANYYKGNRDTIFTAVRYGNVLGSRGSVVPQFFRSIQHSSSITITDPKMTRFNITLSEALDFILNSLKNSVGGEVFVPKLEAYKLADLAEAIIDIANKDVKINYSSIRTGEKLHESMINEHESPYTVESNGEFVILSPSDFEKYIKLFPNAKTNCIEGSFSSDKVKLIDKSNLKKMINREIFDETNPYRPVFN
jgi:UDP-N-acetylglucosamine 4,6-dehydratase/UDP-glucose 4-epimerase